MNTLKKKWHVRVTFRGGLVGSVHGRQSLSFLGWHNETVLSLLWNKSATIWWLFGGSLREMSLVDLSPLVSGHEPTLKTGQTGIYICNPAISLSRETKEQLETELHAQPMRVVLSGQGWGSFSSHWLFCRVLHSPERSVPHTLWDSHSYQSSGQLLALFFICITLAPRGSQLRLGAHCAP